MNWVAGQTEGSNTAGGYLVPDVLDNAIIDLAIQYGVFRQNARIVPMTSETKIQPRRTGGLTAYFVGESTAGTESSKTWDNVKLIAKKSMVLTKTSKELAEDAIIAIVDDLVGEIGRAFAYQEDNCGFNGDGTSTYGGIVGVREALIKSCSSTGISTGTMSGGLTRYGTGHSYANVTMANLNAVVGTLPTYARMNAKWYCSPLFYNAVMERLLIALGGNTVTEGINGTRTRTFLGYPVIETEIMPTASAVNQVCALFGDLRMAADFGDRRATTLSTSDTAVVNGVS